MNIISLLRNLNKKLLKNKEFYYELLKRHISDVREFPAYFSIDFLNIVKSLRSFNFVTNEIIRKVNGIKFPFYFNEYARYRSMYLGLNSKTVVKTLLRNLTKGTTFIDVGANIGYISSIGLGCVGKRGQVHSFEPVPLYFEKLLRMKRLNKKYSNLYINNFGLGETPGTMNIDISKNIWGWNTMVPNLMDPSKIKTSVKVSIKRLDDYIFQNKVKNISFMKIDVEGFEIPVLKGLTSYFEKEDVLPKLLIEVSPSTYHLLGYELKDLEDFLRDFSYEPYYPNTKTKYDLRKINNWADVLFMQK